MDLNSLCGVLRRRLDTPCPPLLPKKLCYSSWLWVLNFDTLCHAQGPCSYCMKRHAHLFTTKHICSWLVGLDNQKHKLHSSPPFSHKDFFSSVWAWVHMHRGDCRADGSGMRLLQVCKCILVKAVFKVTYRFGPGILLAIPSLCPQHSAGLWLLFAQYLFLCHDTYTRHCPSLHPLWNSEDN